MKIVEAEENSEGAEERKRGVERGEEWRNE